MLTDFIADKSRDEEEQWVVMGNSIGGLLTLMLTESLQAGRKVRETQLSPQPEKVSDGRCRELRREREKKETGVVCCWCRGCC